MSYKYEIVLIVDDNVDNDTVSKKITEGTGFCRKIYFHDSIDSAFDFFRNMSKAGMPLNVFPQLIILDLYAPVVKGQEFLMRFSEIREEWALRCRIIMILNKGEEPELSGILPQVRYIYKPRDKEGPIDMDI
jgi:CheY-like chemotaxis protein